MRARYVWALAATVFAAPSFAQPAAQRPGFYTTKPGDAEAPLPPPVAADSGGDALPWQNQAKPVIAPVPAAAAPIIAGPTTPPAAAYIPFKRAVPYGQQAVPAPLPMDRAVPVENIDGVEVSEPAAPAENKPQADPAKEDPAAPTELTAPLFAANPDTKTPRTIVLRMLNKVTAHAEIVRAHPGETIPFGRLQIEAEQCYVSDPASQHDTVALLSISEKIPDQPHPKLLFHGWMYASSPSLTALEHPIYDVTMVDCDMQGAPTPKPVDAVKDKAAKPTGNKEEPADTDAPD